jgi:hypothetical protein
MTRYLKIWICIHYPVRATLPPTLTKNTHCFVLGLVVDGRGSNLYVCDVSIILFVYLTMDTYSTFSCVSATLLSITRCIV